MSGKSNKVQPVRRRAKFFTEKWKSEQIKTFERCNNFQMSNLLSNGVLPLNLDPLIRRPPVNLP